MSTIKLTQLALVDGFPGTPNPNLSKPTDGWDNTVDNFATTASTDSASYPIGTKIMGYEDSSYCPGWFTMAYLMYHCYTSGNTISATDISLGTTFCFHYDGSDAQKYGVDASVVPYYVVTKADDDAIADQTEGGAMCIPCATIDAGESSAAYVSGYGDSYGWFWVGGVCPVTECTLFQGTGSGEDGPDISTSTTLRAGPVHAMEVTGNTVFLESCDVSDVHSDSSAGAVPIPVGYLCTSCV